MNYKAIFLFLLLIGCRDYTINTSNKIKPLIINNFQTKGFALIYSKDLHMDKLISKKIEKRSLIIFQKRLKKDTNVLITNLINNKSLIATVGDNANYPVFYNSVISIRIADELDIDIDEPYVEIQEILKNNSFIAKKGKIFDEEKKVASKVPVDDIKIKDLSTNKIKKKPKPTKKFNYTIKIADFYFKKSAKEMAQIIKNKTKIKQVKINQLSKTQYRVTIGSFKDLYSLKKAFNDISNLQFDNIEIIKTSL